MLLTDDGLVLRGATRAVRECGLPDAGEEGGPALVIVDVERPGALDAIKDLRARYPGTLIAGHLASPRRDLWVAAERAGCDLVCNRGALASKLRARLAVGGDRRVRYPLFDSDDVAGRLGLVRRVDDTPVGPIAVYHIGGSVYAAQDVCPHAGAVLSDGELDGAIITCPLHGSRFDVRSGERVRGPADVGVRTFPVEEDGGLLYLVDVGA